MERGRRDFLWKGATVTGGVALGALGTWVFSDLWMGAHKFSSARWVAVGSAEQFIQEAIVPFPEYKLAMVRSGGKIGAISLECTHLGCLLNVEYRGFFCPCHGSKFGPQGEVYLGPAPEPLPWYKIREERGKIWIYLGEKMKIPQWLKTTEEAWKSKR